MTSSSDLSSSSAERTPQAPYPNRTVPHRRRIDRSNAEARLAVAGVASRFGTWRASLAQMRAQADRSAKAANRAELLDRCDIIAGEVEAARADLLVDLADAPRKVVGHSRVLDIERAFANLESELAQVRDALRQSANEVRS